ncbi:MAG: S-layer protein, partial [Nanoarchaeota archaeon]
MNVKKAIKRIAALGTGAALMGATVLGAMAADLNDFPSPFVQDGQFNAMLVVGESAQTPDIIGAVDIATVLQYE